MFIAVLESMILNTTLLETNIDRDNQSLGHYFPLGKAYVQGLC